MLIFVLASLFDLQEGGIASTIFPPGLFVAQCESVNSELVKAGLPPVIPKACRTEKFWNKTIPLLIEECIKVVDRAVAKISSPFWISYDSCGGVGKYQIQSSDQIDRKRAFFLMFTRQFLMNHVTFFNKSIAHAMPTSPKYLKTIRIFTTFENHEFHEFVDFFKTSNVL